MFKKEWWRGGALVGINMGGETTEKSNWEVKSDRKMYKEDVRQTLKQKFQVY